MLHRVLWTHIRFYRKISIFCVITPNSPLRQKVDVNKIVYIYSFNLRITCRAQEILLYVIPTTVGEANVKLFLVLN
jgi:hypothetical protein